MGKKKGKSNQSREGEKPQQPGTSTQTKQKDGSGKSEQMKQRATDKEQGPQPQQAQQSQWGPSSRRQEQQPQQTQQSQWGPSSRRQEQQPQQTQQSQWGPSSRREEQQPQQMQQPQWGPSSRRQEQQPQQTQQPQWGPSSRRQEQQPQQTQQSQWGPSSRRQEQQPQQAQQHQWGPSSRREEQQPQQMQQSQWGPSSRRQEQQPQQAQQSQWGPSSRRQEQQPQQTQQPQWGPSSRRQEQQPQQAQQSQWGPSSRRQEQQPQQMQQSQWGPSSRREEQQPQQAQQSQWGPSSRRQEQQPQQAQQSQWGPGSRRQEQQPQQTQQSQWGPSSRGQEQQPQQIEKPPQQDPSSREKEDVGKEGGGSKSSPSADKKFGTVLPYEFTPRIWAARKSGRPIKINTNFFPLTIGNPNIIVCHYDVVIEPDKPKHLIREVWNRYMDEMFPNRLAAFDGKNAYTRGPLENWQSGAATISILNAETQREKEFKVSITEVRRVSFECFRDYRKRMLQDRSLKVLPEAEMVVLDIILRNWASDKFVKCGRSFFPLKSTSSQCQELSGKLCMHFGYFQAAFLGFSPYLNFDLAHKTFYKDLPLLEILDFFKPRYGRDLDMDGLNHFLRTVKVGYQLPNDPSSFRTFRVNKLVDNANMQTFKTDDGKTIIVAQYFQDEKKIKLKYPDLPLLWVGPTQRSIYIPMEFCRILPNQPYKGFIDTNETREFVKLSTSNARERQREVNKLFKEVNINSHPLMKEFELQVSGEMEKLEARVLNPPDLQTSRIVRVKDGIWRIQDFLEPVTLNKWCILILDKRVSKQSVMDLQKLVKDKGSSFNMRIADPAKNPIEADPSITGLKRAFSQLKDMQLVFVIISDAKGVYSKVKAICETQEGILTQCVKSRTVSQDPRKLSTTIENILLKVNAKLGGKNHCLEKSSVPVCLNGYVMVVGADVTHPSPGMNIPSVAAVTVSCDPAAFQYSTETRVQPKGELIKDLEDIISIHVKKFHQIRKRYPEKIIFFRDGVSEGEMEKVLKAELTAVKRACSPNCQPKITFVIVQKRHHTRFFAINPADEQGRNFNVPVGTCVDTDIVHPRELDFYLVSHASILGTARPTRYRLLHDDNKLTDDELEKLAFYLCHLFSRCNRSVSYPSPTYNAHLAAARVRAYLEGLNLLGEHTIDEIKKNLPDRISSISPMFFV